jgi:ATP-dependent Clp protease ATP-binding subunit ClpB
MGRTTKLLNPAQPGREAQKLEDDLRQRIVGQDEAIEQVVQVYQTNLTGMASPGRPIGSLLFLGPTGSGKTRLVEAVAESLLGDARAVVKVDCAEFQHSHEISKLIGSPPGYLGHRETHSALSQQALDQYHTEKVKISLVLFDEIEKASDALWNLLLGILDKATLTLGDNRRVDFSRALIFMTSNLGASEIGSLLRPNIGFAARQIASQQETGVIAEGVQQKIARAGVEAARRKFTPEFMNRIDKTVVFRPLGPAELQEVLTIELKALQERIRNAHPMPFLIIVSDSARAFLLREGTDPRFGARHLKRAIDRNLVHPLSNLIATRQVVGGDVVHVDFDSASGHLSFSKDGAWTTTAVMSRLANASAGTVTEIRGIDTAIDSVGWFKTRSTKR